MYLVASQPIASPEPPNRGQDIRLETFIYAAPSQSLLEYCYKRCFCTLPSAVRGSLSTSTNRRGSLNEASFSRQADSTRA